MYKIKATDTSTAAWQVIPWIMVLTVLGICGAISIWLIKRPARKGHSLPPYAPEDSYCDPRLPMIKTTIRDMIELTTSGSGSGN